MPLQKGKAGIGPNIKMLQKEGRPKAQAIAISLDVARRSGADIPKPPKLREKKR